MCNRPVRGFTLIEMIIAIVIISVGLAGVMLAFNSVRASADPLIRKQMLAVAEEMMEEILLKPYAVSGTTPTNGATTCGTAASDRSGFDDVGDYNNYQTSGICFIDGTAVTGLEAYAVNVTVASVTWQGVAATLQIVVTVTHGNDSISLTGWRTPYAQ